MNRTVLRMLIICLAVAGCGSGQLFGPTSIPTPTVTLTPTATPVPTQTPTPTQTPVSASYVPVPRWMILAQPGYGVEILGETWNYTKDGWNDFSACISYTRERTPYVYFEECFGLVPETGISFETMLADFLQKEFETLTPKSSFADVGLTGLLAKRLEENSEKFIKIFEMVGTEKYILLVEMNIVTDDEAPLQKIYESQAADTIDYVLQNGLEKSHILPRSTATPLSPRQERIYTALNDKLITESKASELYGSTWEALGERVFDQRALVCRTFEDRTNADVRWVRFENCVVAVRDMAFEDIASLYPKPGDITLESGHKYDNEFVLYGYQDGHTYFDAYLLDGEFIYSVTLESRTFPGEKVKDVFDQDIDDFLYEVLMTNVHP